MTEDIIASPEVELLPGVGKLGRQLEYNGDRALFEVELEHGAQQAVAELRPAGTPEADQQLARWRESLALDHPHLLKLYGAGESTWAGEPVIYLTSERAEESLAGVLEERALSEQEAREMLEPVLQALSYLHRSGFAHAELTAANVRAVENTLKLSSANVLRTDAGGDPAADMRSVGVLVVQSLTRNSPEVEEDSGPYILRDASEPFSAIVRHCLDPDRSKRWTAEQALACLSPNPPAPAAPPQQQAQAPIKPPSAAPARPAAVRANSSWKYGAAALLVIAAIGATIGLTRSKTAAPTTVPPQAPVTAPVSEATPTRQPVLPRAAAPKPTPSRDAGWAVVVASYGARSAAEKRAKDLRKRWPKFHPEVFEPPSQKTRNLVVIGKNLSQANADALRKRARQAGLPRDVYIKRFE